MPEINDDSSTLDLTKEDLSISKSADDKAVAKIKLLTDDLVSSYSGDNVISEYRDIDFKVKTKLSPYPKGVYDQDIFGSLFSNRCNCGSIRSTGIRCPRCGSIVLDEIQQYRRFGRIELPIYYSSIYKSPKIKSLLKEIGIRAELNSKYFDGLKWRSDKVLDICQWDYDEESKSLLITDNITDFTKCGWEGLIGILSTKFPDYLSEIKSYLNRYIIVVPMALRAPNVKIVDGERKLENSDITSIYRNIIYIVNEYYPTVFPSLKTEFAKAVFRGCIRRMVNSSTDRISQLMQSSKENMARYMQANRLPNSGRCVVVPDTSIKADEVYVPRGLMYEACRDEFIDYISKRKGISNKEAEIIYRTQSELDEVQKMFEEYIDGDPKDPMSGKYILINRPPSLSELSIFACKVKLTYDYAMKIPHAVCPPMNADFDGDQLAFYAIPKNMNALMNKGLSPKNRFLYRKNNNPLFIPDGDLMQGLVQATKVIIPKDRQRFESVTEAEEYMESHPEFKYQTQCMIDNKVTTLGRSKLGVIFDKNIDEYLKLTKSESITGKNIGQLYEQLRDKSDRMERIRDVQEFGTLICTLSGATAPRLQDLYVGIDESYLNRMDKINNNSKLDEKTKEVAIREIFGEYQIAEMDKIPHDLQVAIGESDKAKASELRDMAVQQLNIGPDKRYSIASTSLISGLSSEDYESHAIENRAVLDIKQMAVPMSGYMTRQFTYLASEWTYVDGEDKDNKGILVSGKYLIGRTKLDGSIIKSDPGKPTLVRSIITSTLPSGHITHDMISDKFKYKVGDRIGMSSISAFTESLTQAGLALKHSGHLFDLPDEDNLIAPDDVKLDLSDTYIRLTSSSSSKDYIYPRPKDWVSSYAESGVFNKGKIVGCNYHLVTPTYGGLDKLVKLCGARSTNPDKQFERNQVELADCYCIADGKIHYNGLSNGIKSVTIGEVTYDYNYNSLYYFPDGADVKRGDRICSGVFNVNKELERTNDEVELYYFFRLQFRECIDWMSDDLIEFVFRLIVSRNENNQLEIQSVLKTVHGSDSFYKSLAFGDARKSFTKIDNEGMDFIADPLTQVILPLITTDNLK